MNGVEPLRMSLFRDHAGVLWALFSSKNGLAVVDRASNRVTPYSFNNSWGQNTGVDSIYEDVDGTLWLGTGSSGLLKLDRDRKRFVRYRSNPRDPERLGSGIVLAVFGDREGSIWVGTREGGVNRFDSLPGVQGKWRGLKPIPRHRGGFARISVAGYSDGRPTAFRSLDRAVHHLPE